MQGSMKHRDFPPVSRFIWEMIQDRAILTMADQYDLSNVAIFNYLERPLAPISRSRHYLMLNLRNGTRYTVSMEYRDLHMPYSRVSFRMTLNQLVKSMTRSVARSLCDSWASCRSVHNVVGLIQQELSYRKQIASKLRTQYVEGIYRPKYYTVTLKCRFTQGHCKRNHWIDHKRLTVSRVIWRWILSRPWIVG